MRAEGYFSRTASATSQPVRKLDGSEQRADRPQRSVQNCDRRFATAGAKHVPAGGPQCLHHGVANAKFGSPLKMSRMLSAPCPVATITGRVGCSVGIPRMRTSPFRSGKPISTTRFRSSHASGTVSRNHRPHGRLRPRSTDHPDVPEWPGQFSPERPFFLKRVATSSPGSMLAKLAVDRGPATVV